MSARIVTDLSERREAKLAERFGVKPDDTSLPLGYLAARMVERTRLVLEAGRQTERRR